ncbi:MAG: hypothetical protein PHY08_06125 [Candidatus Cloacimonetes bacterium]|jgi:hypothetical protein|nr:hypothetical protein [Candidatus Cloacimonadota bacterium]MDD4156136.1 hypothetical protein [Candidatus Cloacimonadota bacterium]
MSQIKALIKKEFWTQKNLIFLPFYIQGGIYLLMLIVILVAWLKSDADLNFVSTGLENFSGEIDNIYFWIFGTIITIIPAVLVLFSYFGVSTNIVNDDYKHKCVLFYNTIPVSFLKKILVKISFVTVISGASILAISIINIIINSIIASFFIKIHIGYILLGLVQSFVLITLSMIFIQSIVWLFASIFKTKTGNSMIITYVIYKMIAVISKVFIGDSIYKLFSSFENYIVNLVLPNLKISFQNLMMEEYAKDLIITNWNNIFSFNSIQKIIFATILFTISAFIIQKREIE